MSRIDNLNTYSVKRKSGNNSDNDDNVYFFLNLSNTEKVIQWALSVNERLAVLF